MATLYWWFLVGSVLALSISIILSLLVWANISIGRMMASIYRTDISCIVSSSLMHPTRFRVMAKLVGNFPVDLKYSDLP